MKKPLSVLLVVSMLASMAVPAMAEDDIQEVQASTTESTSVSVEIAEKQKEAATVEADAKLTVKGDEAAEEQKAVAELAAPIDEDEEEQEVAAGPTLVSVDAQPRAAMAQSQETQLTFERDVKIGLEESPGTTGHTITLTATNPEALQGLKAQLMTLKGQKVAGDSGEATIKTVEIRENTLILQFDKFMDAGEAYTLDCNLKSSEDVPKYALTQLSFQIPAKQKINLGRLSVVRGLGNQGNKYNTIQIRAEGVPKEDAQRLNTRVVTIAPHLKLTGGNLKTIGTGGYQDGFLRLIIGDQGSLEFDTEYQINFKVANELSNFLFTFEPETVEFTYKEAVANIDFAGGKSRKLDVQQAVPGTKLAEFTPKNQKNEAIQEDKGKNKLIAYTVSAQKDKKQNVNDSFTVDHDTKQLKISKPLEKGKYTITVTANLSGQEDPPSATIFDLEVTESGVVPPPPPAMDQLKNVTLTPDKLPLKVSEATANKVLSTASANVDGVTFSVAGATKDGADAKDKFKVEGNQLKLAKQLEKEDAGTYVVTVKGEKGNMSKENTFTLTVNADAAAPIQPQPQPQPPVPPTPPATPDKPSHSGGSSSSHRHNHPSSNKTNKNNKAAKANKETAVSGKPSANVSSNGTVSANDAVKQVNASVSANNKAGSVLVENAKAVSGSALKEMAQAAAAKGGTATLKADTVVNGVTEGRMYIDAAKGASLTGDFNLTVRTTSNEAKAVEKLFDKYFKNNVDVVTLSQKGDLGMTVRVAVKADLTNMNKDALKIYYYDRTNNSYHMMPNPNYKVDANGFVHFDTNMGGDIIISDNVLTQK